MCAHGWSPPESKEVLPGFKHELEVVSSLELSLSETREKIRQDGGVGLGPLLALCPGGLFRVSSQWDLA